MAFQKGHSLSTGRPKGSKNRISRDIRQVFNEVYEEMGANQLDSVTGKPMTGKEAMLDWARNNPTEFYRLFGKMIPTKEEVQEDDCHEDFLDELILDEEIKLIECKDVTEVGEDMAIPMPSGADDPHNRPDNAPHPKNDADMV